MKNLVVLIISILSIGILFISCKKDKPCLASDAAGTYTGTKECDDMDAVPVTFQVNAGDSDIQIIIDGVTTVIEDCDIFGSSIVQGTGREIDGDIDGNEISFVETNKVNGQVDFRCVWKGVRN
jgi:hypothetical protein